MEAKEDHIKKDYGAREALTSYEIVPKKDGDAKKRGMRRKIIRLIFDGFVPVFIGMSLSQRGPAFLDLQLISGANVEETSSYFTFHSFGYMIGALVAGFLFDRLDNKLMMISVSMTLASFFIAITPLCTSYITMLLAHIAMAVMCSVSETVITADQFRIWQGKSDSALQFFGFTFSMGGMLGPLYTEPFLAPKWNETNNTAPRHDLERNHQTDTKVFSYSSINLSTPIIPTNVSISNSDKPPGSDLFYAYLITGLFGLILSIPFYVLCCKKCSKSEKSEKQLNTSVEVKNKRLTFKAYVVLTAISCFFQFSYAMIEDSFAVFLPMFVIYKLSWTKENGALISSLYWGLGTISKLLIILLVRRIDMGILLLISCVGMFISLAAFLFASMYHIHVLIWISSSAFALSQSPLFGGLFSWVDTNIFKIDGKATSASMVFASIGAMSGPLVLGITMDKISLMTFPYIELAHSAILLFLFALVFFFLKRYVTQKYGPVRTEDYSHAVDEHNEEVGEESIKEVADQTKFEHFT